MKRINIILILVLIAFNTSAQFMGGNGSGYAQGSLSIPLPYSEVELTARKDIDGNRLDWKIIADGNVKVQKVELEQSKSQSDWIVLFSTVDEDHLTYSYVDEKPTNGKNYYRLKITDKNYAVHYSRTVTMTNVLIEGVKLYPVPATDLLVLENRESVNLLEIIDVEGKIIRSMAYRGLNRIQLSINDLQPGLYYLRVDNSLILKFNKR